MLFEWHIFCSEPGYLISAVPVFELKLAASKCMFTIQVRVISIFSSEYQKTHCRYLLAAVLQTTRLKLSLQVTSFQDPWSPVTMTAHWGPEFFSVVKAPDFQFENSRVEPSCQDTGLSEKKENTRRRGKGDGCHHAQPATNNVSLSW